MGKKRFAKRLKWLFLIVALLIPAVLLFSFVRAWYRVDSDEILTKARLSELPNSIENLTVETRHPTFNQRWLFMRFQAEPNDIHRFISSSPGIDPNRSRPLNAATAPDSEDNPDWWSMNLSLPGRAYGLPAPGTIMGGNVLVDDDTDTVLIFIAFKVHERMRIDPVEEFLEDAWHEVQDLFGY